jgi:hypothetical protein
MPFEENYPISLIFSPFKLPSKTYPKWSGMFCMQEKFILF